MTGLELKEKQIILSYTQASSNPFIQSSMGDGTEGGYKKITEPVLNGSVKREIYSGL